VSSVFEFSLHCSSSSAVLDIVWSMVSFAFRSQRGEPCVFQVCSNLSHALMISSSLSGYCWMPSSPMFFCRVHWLHLLFCFTIYLSNSYVVFIPLSCSTPGHLCVWASFMSNACKWVGNSCCFWIQLVTVS